VSKETYYSVKRDLLQCQKRPTTVSKETYYSDKRELPASDYPVSTSLRTCVDVVWPDPCEFVCKSERVGERERESERARGSLLCYLCVSLSGCVSMYVNVTHTHTHTYTHTHYSTSIHLNVQIGIFRSKLFHLGHCKERERGREGKGLGEEGEGESEQASERARERARKRETA
jgi:hypothetical protein